MTNRIVLANSTGTLVDNIGTQIHAVVERRAAEQGVPDLFARIDSPEDFVTGDLNAKDVFDQAFDHYVLACDASIMDPGVEGDGAYNPFLVNGAEALPRIMGERKIGIYAAALGDFLLEAYKRNELSALTSPDGVISHFFAICDPELQGGRESGVGRKDLQSYRKVDELLRREGLEAAAYLSHKSDEAEMGALAYGNGIFIGSEAKAPRVESGVIHVVPSIDSREFREAVDRVHSVG